MALFQMTIPSKVMRRESMVSVILPDVREIEVEKEIYDFVGRFPVLYLLHGAGGNHLDWIRYTTVEQLANKYQTAVVMPAAELGFYTDMINGGRYFTYISEELPSYLEKIFPISEKREEHYTAGLSMGGYGAMKLALTFPDRFRAVASMSGVLDVAALMRDYELSKEIELDKVLRWCYGNENGAAIAENNLEALLKRTLSSDGPIPDIYQCIGTEDFLYEINLKFRKALQKTKIPFTYEESEGKHNWEYWNQQLPLVFKWLFEVK